MKHLALSLMLVFTVGAQAAKFKRVLGQTFPEVKVQDLHTGKEIDLRAKLKDEKVKGAVVVFTCQGCPVAVAYQKRINELIGNYGKEIVFIQLNSNAGTETAESWAKYTGEKRHHGLIALDSDSRIAKEIGASVTPETYLLDKTGKIVYHGPVDDSQDVQYLGDHLLAEAIEALLFGKEVKEENREVQASGCTIKFLK